MIDSNIKSKLTLLVTFWCLLTFGFFFFIGSQVYLSDRSQLSRSGSDSLVFKDGSQVFGIIRSLTDDHNPELPTTRPQAEESAYLVPMNQALTLTMKATDLDSPNLNFTIISNPNSGHLGPVQNLGRSARVLYTPNNGFRGNDQFLFRVTDESGNGSNGKVNQKIMPELLPWMEVNLPDHPALEFHTEEQGATPDMTQLDFVIQALPNWAKVANRMILTTRIGYANSMYTELNQRKPANLKMIGGIKTISAMPLPQPPAPGSQHPRYDFANAGAWQQVAQDALAISSITGSKEVVLENESALLAFWGGYQPVDLLSLTTALQPLRNLSDLGIEFWWWLPEIHLQDYNLNDNFDPGVASTALVNTIKNTVPNSKFITTYAARYWWYEPDEENRAAMVSTVGLNNIIEGLWVVRWLPDLPPECHNHPDPEDHGFVPLDPTLPRPGAYWNCGRMYSTSEAIAQLTGHFPRWPGDNNTRTILSDKSTIYPRGGNDWHIVAEEFKNTLPGVGLPGWFIDNLDPVPNP